MNTYVKSVRLPSNYPRPARFVSLIESPEGWSVTVRWSREDLTISELIDAESKLLRIMREIEQDATLHVAHVSIGSRRGAARVKDVYTLHDTLVAVFHGVGCLK